MKEIEERLEMFKESKSNELDLSALELSEIPDFIFEMTEIETLNLMNNNLTDVPNKIGSLTNLRELWLSQNNLTNIPTEISELPNLKRLHLSQNQFEEFPIEFIHHQTVSHLCLRHNNITELPTNIEEITIRDVSFKGNQISEIPITYENADIFLSFELRDNPLVDPPSEIFRAGAGKLLRFLIDRERGTRFKIPFTSELRTTFKQYLTYFGDFVRNTKGKHIAFEVKSYDEGIEIEVTTENNTDEEIEEVRSYMQEYVSFIKENVDDLNPSFSKELAERNVDLAMVELRSQVRHVQTQLEIKVAQNKVLQEDKDKLMKLVEDIAKNNATINITNELSNKTLVIQENKYTTEINANLPDLLSSLNDFRSLIPEEASNLHRELAYIDSELLEIEDCRSEDIKKAPFKKIKRILDEINNEESTLNKTITASKKLINAAQGLGRTYNKIAEWVALPQVPKILVGKE